MKNIRCKICSSETITVTALSALYYKCINCGYVFKNISSKPGKKETKERYLPHENTSDNSGYVEMFNNFLEKAVFPFSGPPGQVLDFGCGYGPVLSEILSRSGYTTDIYDKYFFRKKPWPEDMPKYNIITSTEVFEHIRHPLLILKFLKKLLKPGGIIALMTLFAPDDVDSFKNWWYLRDSTHISFYSVNTFTMLAKKTDLKILKTDNKNICTLAKKTNVLY